MIRVPHPLSERAGSHFDRGQNIGAHEIGPQLVPTLPLYPTPLFHRVFLPHIDNPKTRDIGASFGNLDFPGRVRIHPDAVGQKVARGGHRAIHHRLDLDRISGLVGLHQAGTLAHPRPRARMPMQTARNRVGYHAAA